MIPYSRPKRSDLYTQLLENHTLHSGTGLTAAQAWQRHMPIQPNPPPPPGGYGQEKYWKCTGEIYIPTGGSYSFPLLSSSLFFLALWLRTGKACSHLDVHVIPSAQTKSVRVFLPDKQFRHVVLNRKTSQLHWTQRLEILTAWTARWRNACFRKTWYCVPWQRQRAKFLSHLQVPVHVASPKI